MHRRRGCIVGLVLTMSASMFNAMDQNHDGVITRAEFAAAMQGGAPPMQQQLSYMPTVQQTPCMAAGAASFGQPVMQSMQAAEPVTYSGMPQHAPCMAGGATAFGQPAMQCMQPQPMINFSQAQPGVQFEAAPTAAPMTYAAPSPPITTYSAPSQVMAPSVQFTQGAPVTTYATPAVEYSQAAQVTTYAAPPVQEIGRAHV